MDLRVRKAIFKRKITQRRKKTSKSSETPKKNFRKVIVKNSPVTYLVEVEVNGKSEWVSTSPPDMELVAHLNLKMKMILDNGFGIVCLCVDQRFVNMYQAAAGGVRLLLNRFQESEEVSPRLVLEVWGTEKWQRGILDVFGFITVDHGRVTEESFANYQESLAKQREVAGENFPEDSLRRCPQTLEEMQQVHDRKARAFRAKYQCDHPAQKRIEDFAVESKALPTGGMEVSQEEVTRFVQGHMKVLGSNALARGSTATLISNIEAYEKEADRNELNNFISGNAPASASQDVSGPKAVL